jgi:hypothetical protein
MAEASPVTGARDWCILDDSHYPPTSERSDVANYVAPHHTMWRTGTTAPSLVAPVTDVDRGRTGSATDGRAATPAPPQLAPNVGLEVTFTTWDCLTLDDTARHHGSTIDEG